MLINKLWIAFTAIMISVLWIMMWVHNDYIIKQGRQIKQLEAALLVHQGERK
jgi:hypothetical protein